ncbi:TonB-dependent receptor [Sphingomonas bacterium]|uniref:TonB-dependent receptor n=1 Tax=Sphingomonas bacterium TaxID=1895847 RepID=UPI001576D8A8|nr:TonB-dependent receptor [Sphingomonas bacterium]
MTISLRHSMLGMASALALAHAAPALAQNAPATAVPADPGDIVVTARRTEERLQDVPISITVFSQQQIASRNILTPADLSTYTPSLETNNFFGTAKTEFAIRGFSQDIGTQPAVGVYFADVVAPRAPSVNVPAGDGAGPGSLFDLQNIQVLKGPQGTLFGRNTTGGAVLLVPQRPTDKTEGFVEGSYGNYDMKRIQAVFNTPLGDKGRFRIGVDRVKRDGYLKNSGGIGPDRFNGTDYLAVRASLVVDLTPDLENYTIVSYSRSNAIFTQKLATCNAAVALGALACDQLARSAARGDGFYTVQTAIPDLYDHQEQWQVVNTTTWTASDSLTIKNIASYAQYKERYSSEIFATQFDANVFVPFVPRNTFISLATSQPVNGDIANANQATLTDEFRLSGTAFDRRLTWQGGVYAEISNPLGQTGAGSQSLVNCSDLAKLVCNNPIGAGGVQRFLTRTTLHDYGVYAQGTYKLTDRLNLTGGIRYTWDRARSDASLFSYLYPFSVAQLSPSGVVCAEDGLQLPGCAVRYSISSHKPTWLIDLDYKPSRNILLYAKYSRGYRAGNISPNAPAQVATYRPEKLDAYEIGLKTSFGGALHGTFDVAGFYNDLTDQQLLVLLQPIGNTGAPPISGTLNAGKSRIAGAEVSASITPFTGFTLDGAYTYLYTKLRSINANGIDSSVYRLAPSERPGDPLPLSPKNKFTLTGTYILPLAPKVGQVALSATFVHVDKLVSNYSTRNADGSLGPFDIVPSRDLLNLNLNWKSVAETNIDLSLFATNVTNKHYYSFFAPLLAPTGFTSGAVGEPRMYGARLRYHFGS